jgi:hypothetical protein
MLWKTFSTYVLYNIFDYYFFVVYGCVYILSVFQALAVVSLEPPTGQRISNLQMLLKSGH